MCHLLFSPFVDLLLAHVAAHRGEYSPNKRRGRDGRIVGKERGGGVLRYAGTAVPPQCES